MIGAIPDTADEAPPSARPSGALPARATTTDHHEADGPPTDPLDLLDLLGVLSA